MAQRNTALPEFTDPPVVETVLGVSFAPLANWDIRFFGLFWSELKASYPGFQTQPALAEYEQTGGMGVANLIIQAVGVTEPPLRSWLIDATQTQLLQVQRDRFLRNWRKISGSEVYPRYDVSVKPHFLTDWHYFHEFIVTHRLEKPTLRNWEVTYVNHFEKHREWNSIGDFSRIMKCFQGAVWPSVGIPLAASLDLKFTPREGIDLGVTLRPAIRQRDGKEVFVLNLTARGQLNPDTPLDDGLDEGRALIVRTFTDLTSDEMHKLWGRTN